MAISMCKVRSKHIWRGIRVVLFIDQNQPITELKSINSLLTHCCVTYLRKAPCDIKSPLKPAKSTIVVYMCMNNALYMHLSELHCSRLTQGAFMHVG